MVCKTDLSFFDIILLQYYSINTFIVVGGLLLVIFGTASIYKSASECSHRVFAMEKVLGAKVNVTFYFNKEKTIIQYVYALRIGTAPVGFSII